MTNRSETEQYIIKSIAEIDIDNANRYKEFFSKLSNKQFDDYMKTLKEQKTSLYIYMPNMKKNLTNNKIIKKAKKFKVVLFDHIRFKNNYNGKYYYTKYKYLILTLPVRRVKQYLFDKIALPESDKHISRLSGQVMKPDKGSRISLIETYMLTNRKLEKSIIEFIKIRGGDIKSYNEFKTKLLENGSVYLSELDLDESQTRSTIVADDYLKGIHIDVGLLRRK